MKKPREVHMQSTVVMFARKPQSRPASQPARRTRRNLLARLRDDILIMRTIGFDQASIGEALKISPKDVRALSRKAHKQVASRNLTPHAIEALLMGCYGHLGGKTIATRAKNLGKIASAYSLQELLEEPGVGAVTAMEIQLWLEERGYALRDEDSPPQPTQ
jgi:hypothetical protein